MITLSGDVICKGVFLRMRCSWTTMAVVVAMVVSVIVGHLTRMGSANEEVDKTGNDDCLSMKQAYGSKGFNDHDVPSHWIPGKHLQICKQVTTCCTQEMEDKLVLQSSHEFGKLLADKLNHYRQTFVTRSAKFDEYFSELIDQSHTDLNDMFLRTYGQLYQQNMQLFLDLFRDLRSYYERTDVNIADVLDGFFSLLMQRIFRLLNDEHVFSDSFFNCIGEHMDQLKPFGDIPLKLHMQLKRSFTAARVFVEGVGTGSDVILAMSKLERSQSCANELMQLTYCSYCGGFTNTRPCANYCLAVLSGCLGYFADINQIWNNYLGELQLLATRLDGPFNIEMVVSPLGVKISEAIMVFQENSGPFSSKVFQGCGEPKLRHHSHNNETRRKRRELPRSTDFDFGVTSSTGSTPGSLNHSSPGISKMSLSRLIRDFQSKLEMARDMWKKLPHDLCNETAAPSGDEEYTCWNGSASDSSTVDKTALDASQGVRDSRLKHHTALEKELFELHSIIGRLRNAYSGSDENHIDTDDELSGSGQYEMSGSGSGDESLHITKDIYIEGVSFSHTPVVDSEDHTILPSSTVRPRISGSASNFDLHMIFVGLVVMCLTMCTIHW